MSPGSGSAVPRPPATVVDRPASLAVAFAHALRTAGVAVAPSSTIAYAEALAAVGVTDPTAVYWAGRATLVHDPDLLPTYDQVFATFWGAAAGAMGWRRPVPAPVPVAVDDGTDDAAGPEGRHAGHTTPVLRYSPVEVLADRDLAELTPEEWEEAARLITALAVDPPVRSSRRLERRGRHRGRRVDVATTAERAVRRGGELTDLWWRSPTTVPRRLVLLVDVSGSMAPYARALVRFAHAAVAARCHGAVEVFTIGTRLGRITRSLARHDPDAALAEAAAATPDWAGGTRLGACLARFNDEFGVAGMARGAIVVIGSDGWDRGEPELLAAEMARLGRIAHRVVWVNPLKASPGYAPLAQGMAAALPHVDLFVEGHSLRSLEELAHALSAGAGRRLARRSPGPGAPGASSGARACVVHEEVPR